jgi:hypothetical protein
VSEAKLRDLDPNEVYFVESAEDPSALLALDAKIDGPYVAWFDTSRDRGQRITAQRLDGSALVFETERGTYRFEPLTLERYRTDVRPKVELSPDFGSVEALKTFYLESFLGRSAGG